MKESDLSLFSMLSISSANKSPCLILGRWKAAASRHCWSVEEMDVCFIVRDLNEQVLAYFSTRR